METNTQNLISSRATETLSVGNVKATVMMNLRDHQWPLHTTANLMPFASPRLWVRRIIAAACIVTSSAFGQDVAGKSEIYTERYRPQFHYTTQKGWIIRPR